MLALLLAATFAVSADGGLESATPRSVGMSAARLETIDRVVARGIRAGGYPGAAVVVGRKGKAVWERGFGRLDWSAGSRAVDPATTIYDLASLTKVVGTTTAAMILFDEGRLHLDAYVRYYIPEFTGGWKDSVTIRQLLTHRSGLPAGRDLWRIAYNPEEARRYAIETDLAYVPGTRYIYSDLGADLLGFV
ncbi:MAG TPA: serine hydrolase domain-containing protein, partial [Gemmatimonadaceae bacterium]